MKNFSRIDPYLYKDKNLLYNLYGHKVLPGCYVNQQAPWKFFSHLDNCWCKISVL